MLELKRMLKIYRIFFYSAVVLLYFVFRKSNVFSRLKTGNQLMQATNNS